MKYVYFVVLCGNTPGKNSPAVLNVDVTRPEPISMIEDIRGIELAIGGKFRDAIEHPTLVDYKLMRIEDNNGSVLHIPGLAQFGAPRTRRGATE